MVSAAACSTTQVTPESLGFMLCLYYKCLYWKERFSCSIFLFPPKKTYRFSRGPVALWIIDILKNSCNQKLIVTNSLCYSINSCGFSSFQNEKMHSIFVELSLITKITSYKKKLKTKLNTESVTQIQVTLISDCWCSTSLHDLFSPVTVTHLWPLSVEFLCTRVN